MKRSLAYAVVVAAICCALLFDTQARAVCGASEPARGALIDTIRDNPDLVTFYMLLKKSGLGNTLRAGTSYTVFAPTDAAFSRVPKEKMVELEGDPNKLKNLLMYHIAPGRYFRTNLPGMRSLTAMSGHNLALKGRNADSLSINEANLTPKSAPASNGAVHLIDAVMWPQGNLAEIPALKPPASLVEVLKTKGNYKVMLQALESTGLGARINQGAFTLFAPTDEAFGKDPGLMSDKARLEQVLSYHISPRMKNETKDVSGIILQVSTLYGKPVYFKNVGGTTVNDALVIAPDMRAGEGIVHGIDRVLSPKDADARASRR